MAKIICNRDKKKGEKKECNHESLSKRGNVVAEVPLWDIRYGRLGC